MSNQRKTVLPPALTATIAGVVTVVWAVSFIADVFNPNYDPNPFIHFIMLTVVGAALGHSVMKNGRNNRRNNGY